MIEIRHTNDTKPRYDEIFLGDSIHQMDSFFIWICSLLEIKPNSKVLDIATGRGQMVKFALQRGARSYGIDFSFTGCMEAYKIAPEFISCSDGQKLPFPEDYFDVVTNLGSLEHFINMDLGIQEMARVLIPRGRACIVVPNTFGLRWNVKTAWKTGDVDDDGQPLQRYGTRKQWENLITDNGLRITNVLGYEHERAFPKTSKDMLSYLKHPKRLLGMLLLAPLIPVNAAGQFVFICTKNSETIRLKSSR